MANVYRTKLDIKSSRTSFKPSFVQYDHARLEIELMDNGRPYNLSDVTHVEFTHVRKDGVVIIHPGEIVKGVICYEYQGTEMDVINLVRTSFAIFKNGKKKITSPIFEVNIVKDLRDEIFEPAEPNFGLVQKLIEDVETVKSLGGIKGEPGEKGERGERGEPGYTPIKGVDYFDGVDGKDSRLDYFLIGESSFDLTTLTNANTGVLYNGVTHTVVNEKTVNASVTGSSGFVGLSMPYDSSKKYMAVYRVFNNGTVDIASLRARVDYRNGATGVTQVLGSGFKTPERGLKVGETLTGFIEFDLNANADRTHAAFGFYTRTTPSNFQLEMDVYDITDMSQEQIDNIDWVNRDVFKILKSSISDRANIADSILYRGSSWKDKVWLSIGDSITSPGSYQNIVKEQLGFSEVINRGIAGAAVLGMLRDVTDDDIGRADLITLYGCFNNFIEGGPSIGYITDAPQSEMSGNTFISNLKYVIEYILTRKPTARLVIIGTHNGTDANRPDLNMPVKGTDTIADYTKAMGDVARYYGLPFIDMYGRSGINGFNLNNFTRDGLHLNWDGYVRVAEVITGDLQRIEPI